MHRDMKTSEDIAKSIREIGRDVDVIYLHFVGKDFYFRQMFYRRYANILAVKLYDLNLKSWEIVDVQRNSTSAMISLLNIYLELNSNHQTNIFGDVVEALMDSFGNKGIVDGIPKDL